MSEGTQAAAGEVTPARRKWGCLWWLVPLAGIGLFFMLMVPTMCRSREGANRVKCASNLRQIGLALKIYADANGGYLPPDWRTLAMNAEITPHVFLCPSSANTDLAPGKTPAEWAAHLPNDGNAHNSYRYAAAGLKLADLDGELDILAFEVADYHSGDGMNILYANGNVDWAVTGGANGRPMTPEFKQFLADYEAGKRPLRLGP